MFDDPPSQTVLKISEHGGASGASARPNVLLPWECVKLDRALEQAQGKACDFLAGTRPRSREISPVAIRNSFRVTDPQPSIGLRSCGFLAY
jgi:hypothetical protein